MTGRRRSIQVQSARDRVASNMRARRTEVGLSQDALATRCGLHRTYISSVERSQRNVSLDNVERIAAALGVDVAALVLPTPIEA